MDPSSPSPLMDENIELRRKLEDAMQELHTTKQSLALKQQLEHFLQEELEEVEKMKMAEAEVAVKKEDPEYKKQIQELENELDNREVIMEQLEERVKQLENALEEQIDQSVSKSFSQHSQGEQLSFNEEIFNLNEDNEKLKELVSEIQTDTEKLKHDKARMERENAKKDVMIEEMKCEIASYANLLEETRMQNIEQNMELEEMRMVTSKPAPKGNSIYAELDDRRVASEKLLAALQVQVKTIQAKYCQEHRNNHRLRMQILTMEPKGSELDCEENRNLRLQIIRSNHEVTTLIKKLQDYEKTESALWNKVSEIYRSEGTDSDREKAFSNFLLAMLKSREKELRETKAELRSESMMYWDLNSKFMEKERENCLLEKTKKKLQSQILQLNFRIEELLAKYEPEKSSLKALVKAEIREKIQLDISDEETTTVITESWSNVGFRDQAGQQLKGSTDSKPKMSESTMELEDHVFDEDQNEKELADKENVDVETKETEDSASKKRQSKRGVIHVAKKIQKPTAEAPDCKVQ
ncbi:protein Spindly-B-like [Gigantopelta aegis]|uniref:protein Spindly-B-like n=1 Tax=Gigantopelta aegis TaxID=1735272 RepID=UPI001B88852C|nr:protein Spindly-B-like [Gigantopelta aegis]